MTQYETVQELIEEIGADIAKGAYRDFTPKGLTAAALETEVKVCKQDRIDARQVKVCI